MWYQRQTFQIKKCAIQHITEGAYSKASCTLRGNTGDDKYRSFLIHSEAILKTKSYVISHMPKK